MRRDNGGFSKLEFIVILTVVIVLLVFGVKYVLDSTSGNNYSMYKKEADNFLRQVIYAKDLYPRVDDTYYLYYLLEKNADININNPFNKNEECDIYESFAKTDGSKEVTLKCSNYLINSKNDKYTVFELGEWMEYSSVLENTDFETRLLYNYSKDGREMCSKYMIENEFVNCFNSNEGTKVYGVNDVKEENGIKLLQKPLYRTKKVVKKVE